MEWKITAAVIIIILLSVLFYLSEESETTIEPFDLPLGGGVQNITEEELEKELECLFENVDPNATDVWGESAIRVPAVDENGNGVVTWLVVDIMPGEGRTLTDINQLLFWVDTQYSIQISKAVAANYTKVNTSNLDIVYAIDTEATLVEGPSAGAALTVATVAALYNDTLDPNVMITGTISPDGSIGPVGGVLEKASVAKDIGATVLLVPKGQSVQVTYSQVRECERIGPFTYCRTNYLPERVDIEEEVGIDIIEVSNIGEALKYFL
jgi:uncharacterized protein